MSLNRFDSRSWVWGAVALGLAFASSLTAQTTPLPSRLTDAEFWRLVTTSSEPGGSFPSDNFTSNEMGFPAVIARMRAAGDTAGAYLGVGPEQNFSYIAGLRPRIAFLVDIRRQSVIQHLMYKAIFELSRDRADFVSLLFSKPRPAGLTEASSIADIWEAYWDVPTDGSVHAANLARIVAQLRDTHGFALDSADLASLGRVYTAFFDLGPRIDYAGTRPQSVIAPSLTSSSGTTVRFIRIAIGGTFTAISADSTNTAITGVVRDAATGAPLRGVSVLLFAPRIVAATTNDSGVYRFPDLPSGSVVSIQASRLGYSPGARDTVRLDQRVVTKNLTLSSNAMALNTTIATVPPASAGVGGSTASYYEGTNFASLTAAVDEMGVPRSFLAAEDNYRYMKDLHSRNLFIPIVGDFAGPKAIRAVGQYLREHGTPLTAFYTSNVEGYLFVNQVWRAFYDNVGTLPVTPASVFIRGGTSTCPITAFLAAVAAGRVNVASDATRCAR